MRCDSCGTKVSKEKWVLTYRGQKEIYCYSCFSREWGDYLHDIILIDGYKKKDEKEKQTKLEYYELDIKFKKYSITRVV